MAKILRWNAQSLNAERELKANPDTSNVEDFGSEDEDPFRDAALPEDGSFPENMGGFLDTGIATEESSTEDKLPDAATKVDSDFMEDMADYITDDQGNEFTVDQLVVVQDPKTKEVALFMQSDGESVPPGLTIIGNVTAPMGGLNSSKTVSVNSSSSHASESENRIRELKTTLKQNAVGQVFHDIQVEGKPGIWFSKPLGDQDYVICIVPAGNTLKVFYSVDKARNGGPERVEGLLRKALSSYPTTYKDIYDFMKSFT